MVLLIESISFFVFAIFLHGVFSRYSILRGMNSVKQFLVVGSVTGSLLTIMLYQHYGITFDVLSSLMIYAFLCELYIFIFTMTIGSISANILFNLLKNTLTIEQLNGLYNSQVMVDNRIERLMTTGLIKETPQGLMLTMKGLKLINIFDGFSSFFQHTSHRRCLTDESG